MKAVTATLSRGAFLSDLVELTKPRITLMVVMTTAVGLLVAGLERARSPWLVIGTLLGTWLLAGGASAINQWWERERDALMSRTGQRPIPSGRMEADTALLVGLGLGVLGAALLALCVNLLTALLGLATYGIYVFVYTPLKLRTVWSTVIGAVPGALPPVMGWTAIRGELDPAAWSLFAILFFWQLPHFFAIDWMFRHDYGVGGFRTLATSDASGGRSGRWMIFSTCVLGVASVLPTLFGLASPVYAVAALVLCVVFLRHGVRFARHPAAGSARAAMLFSVFYLPLVLAILVLDVLL